MSAGFIAQDQVTVNGSLYDDGSYILRALTASQMRLSGAGALAKGKIVPANQGPEVTISAQSAGYFDFGRVFWLTGANAGLEMEVKTWDGTSALKLLFKMPNPIAIGDTFIVTPGCSKTIPPCVAFGQILNRDAEDFVKGEDAALSYPNAQ